MNRKQLEENIGRNVKNKSRERQAMSAREICYSYRSAKHKAQQIQILAELNAVDSLEIIKVLVHSGEELPDSTVNKLFKRLDELEEQIREREREYKAIEAALKGEL